MAECSIQEIHVEDIGTVFEVQLIDCDGVVDLTGISVNAFHVTDPDGLKTIKTGTLLTDGTDGTVLWTTIAGDLHMDGTWQLQVWVTLPLGVWHSAIQTFKVKENL